MALVGFLGLCGLVYLANGAVTAGSVQGWYHSLARPAGAPPDWVFAPVWAVLYVCIAVSAWLVWRRVDVGIHRKRSALRIWGWQLLLNSFWPAAFFGLHSLGLGMGLIVALLGLIAMTIRDFWPIQRAGALLLAPYLAWVCYAAYLNAGFLWLNGS